MSLLDISEERRDECRRADVSAKSVLLEIARSKDSGKMHEAVEAIARGSTRDELRARKREDSSPSRRPNRFAFVYRPKDGRYKLALSFAKSRVEKSELIHTLREVIKQLEAGEIKFPKR